jgi:hypothetical protein
VFVGVQTNAPAAPRDRRLDDDDPSAPVLIDTSPSNAVDTFPAQLGVTMLEGPPPLAVMIVPIRPRPVV